MQVIHSGVGAISTNDVLLASASKAIIVGFNVRPERSAAELAEKEEVDIRLHTVIYELIDELRKAMTGLLEPTFREVATGRAEVRETFKVPKVGTIAGCHVLDGMIPRTASVRLLRDNRVIYEGKIASLQRFKDDASEVRAGFDCGIGLERFQDLKPGDIIEGYTREEVAPVLLRRSPAPRPLDDDRRHLGLRAPPALRPQPQGQAAGGQGAGRARPPALPGVDRGDRAPRPAPAGGDRAGHRLDERGRGGEACWTGSAT